MKDLPSKEKKKSFEKPPKVKKEKPPKQSKHSKAEIPDDQKLTAFQERYLEDATLLFEFVENPNVRFLLPKDAICEVLPAGTMINAENGNNSDNRDILMSFIWIHNQKEVDEYEKKLEEYSNKKAEEEEKKRQKEKEEERKNKEQLEKEKSNEKNKEGDELKLVQSLDEVQEGQSKDVEMGDNTTNTVKSEIEVIEISDDVQATEEPEEIKQEIEEIEEIEETEEIEEIEEIVPAKRRAPPRRGKKKRRVPPPKKPTTPKPLEPPVEPEYRFTTLSFTIHGIPSKLVPIFMNSVNPIKEVQTKMKHILEVGTRTSSFYLWYQVDGKLDEELAENIRVLLNQEEKKMTGIPTIQHETPSEPKKYPKKRKIKEESKTGNEQGDDDLGENNNNNNNNNSKKIKVESIEDNDEQNEGNKSENDSKVRDESNELVLKDHDNDESQPQNEDVKEAPVATDTVDSLISDQIEQTPEPIKENSST